MKRILLSFCLVGRCFSLANAVCYLPVELHSAKDKFVKDLGEIYPYSGDRIGELVNDIVQRTNFRKADNMDYWPKQEDALKIIKKGRNSQVFKAILIEGGPLTFEDLLCLFFFLDHEGTMTDREADHFIKRLTDVLEVKNTLYINYDVMESIYLGLNMAFRILKKLPSSAAREKAIKMVQEKEERVHNVIRLQQEVSENKQDPKWKKREEVLKEIQEHIDLVKIMAFGNIGTTAGAEFIHWLVKNGVVFTPEEGNYFMEYVEETLKGPLFQDDKLYWEIHAPMLTEILEKMPVSEDKEEKKQGLLKQLRDIQGKKTDGKKDKKTL